MYDQIRAAIEITSAIMSFILLWFMIKPYKITREDRYIGLPLGFGFLGTTYVISAISFATPHIFGQNTIYFQLIARTFAFFFIGVTYYFSEKPAESRLIWKTILFLSIIALILSLIIVNIPNITLPGYKITRNYFRILDIVFVLYICVHAFRSYIRNPDPKMLWIPIGYVFLTVSQYSTLLFQLNGDVTTLFAGLILRLAFLSIFLIVSFEVFYRTKTEVQHDR
jgi:hypothetical protein